MELYLLALVLHYLQVQAQSLTPLYAVMISLATLIASGLMHYGIYRYNEGKKQEAFEQMRGVVADISHRMTMMEIRFAAHTGRANGGTYRHNEEE